VDSIKHAIDLARAADSSSRQMPAGGPDPVRSVGTEIHAREVRLNPAHLEQNRIVGHGRTNPHGRYYDMLRTQVLQEMDKNSWQFLAVTSPTASCGKSVTACNLAMSISRLPGRPVMLVDMDMHKPMVGEYLGLPPQAGLLSVLEQRVPLSSAIVQASTGPNSMLVLPGVRSSSASSEWMASQIMDTLMQTIRRDFRSRIVIFDLPPVLVGDDVISILPRMDAVLLVAGVGTTSRSDLKECQKHLQRSNVVRIVVNKVTESTEAYRSYY
jgi:Mrp family chromosome partitioning ATPase